MNQKVRNKVDTDTKKRLKDYFAPQNVYKVINQPDKIKSEEYKTSKEEPQQKLINLENELSAYATELELNDFQYEENQTSPLPMLTFNEEKCVVFALENVHTLSELKPDYVWSINQNIATIIHNSLSFKQAKGFIQIGAYKDQYSDLPLQEWKKYIVQYVDSFQNRINLFSSFGMAN